MHLEDPDTKEKEKTTRSENLRPDYISVWATVAHRRVGGGHHPAEAFELIPLCGRRTRRRPGTLSINHPINGTRKEALVVDPP